jgi:hypothetical protein
MTGAATAARDDGPMAITCPRCGQSVEVRWYGPCDACRGTLRSTLGNEARAVEREAFEPALHVTPNAVALKDD